MEACWLWGHRGEACERSRERWGRISAEGEGGVPGQGGQCGHSVRKGPGLSLGPQWKESSVYSGSLYLTQESREPTEGCLSKGATRPQQCIRRSTKGLCQMDGQSRWRSGVGGAQPGAVRNYCSLPDGDERKGISGACRRWGSGAAWEAGQQTCFRVNVTLSSSANAALGLGRKGRTEAEDRQR